MPDRWGFSTGCSKYLKLQPSQSTANSYVSSCVGQVDSFHWPLYYEMPPAEMLRVKLFQLSDTWGICRHAAIQETRSENRTVAVPKPLRVERLFGRVGFYHWTNGSEIQLVAQWKYYVSSCYTAWDRWKSPIGL